MAAEKGSNRPGIDDRLIADWAWQFRVPLLNFFSRHGSGRADPEDLVQEVFCRLLKQNTLAEVEKPEGYVFRVAWSVRNDELRKYQVRAGDAHQSFEEKHHAAMGLTPERVIIGRQDLQGILDLLFELPERTRTVFVLYHFENVRQADIARRLGIGLSTVESHMTKANRYLLAQRARKE